MRLITVWPGSDDFPVPYPPPQVLVECDRRPTLVVAFEVHAQGMGDRALENKVRMSAASGMVSVQAHCTFTEATALMKARARTSGQTLEEVMIAVVDRSVRFGI